MSVCGQGLLDIVYPPLCPLCDRHTTVQHIVCDDCIKNLPRTEEFILRDNNLEQLFYGERRVVRGAAWLFYQKGNATQKLVHHFKYRRHPEVAYQLAREAAYEMMQTDFLEDIELIIPIPLHPRRLRERGYNQSEYIARAISEVSGIPWDEQHHLQRTHYTAKQALKNNQQRQQNVVGAFHVNHPEELYRKHILLVDDVVTTGSTIKACIAALIPCRSCKISIFSLGKAI